MWLLAIDTQSNPASWSAAMLAGLAENTVPDGWNRQLFGAGFSKLAIATSAPLNRSRTAPAWPARFVYGVSQPKGEQFLQVPVMSAKPPLNGKSVPEAWPSIASLTPRSSRMSPPATIVHACFGS